jgi:hypothetical protein
LARQVVGVVVAAVGRFGRFWLTAPEEVPVLAWLKPAMVMHVGVVTLLEALSTSLCIRLSWFLLRRETLDPWDWAMEALVCVFLLFGGIVSESTLLGDQ